MSALLTRRSVLRTRRLFIFFLSLRIHTKRWYGSWFVLIFKRFRTFYRCWALSYLGTSNARAYQFIDLWLKLQIQISVFIKVSTAFGIHHFKVVPLLSKLLETILNQIYKSTRVFFPAVVKFLFDDFPIYLVVLSWINVSIKVLRI